MALILWPVVAGSQGREIHGANAVFAGPGLAIAWAVLRTPVEDASEVFLRIASVDRAYAYVAVDAVDPFSGARWAVLAATPVSAALDVRSRRTTFADFPRREVRLYRSADDGRAGTPSLTVYYLGVPDTTPEFTSEAALLAYLADAVAKAPQAGRAP